MDKATADSLSVQSFAISKNSEHRNFVIGRFQTRARLACAQSPPPPSQTTLLRFFLRGGAAVLSPSVTNNPSSNCPSRLTDKVRRIVHSKLKHSSFKLTLGRTGKFIPPPCNYYVALSELLTRIPDRFYVISIEFLSLRRRRSS